MLEKPYISAVHVPLLFKIQNLFLADIRPVSNSNITRHTAQFGNCSQSAPRFIQLQPWNPTSPDCRNHWRQQAPVDGHYQHAVPMSDETCTE